MTENKFARGFGLSANSGNLSRRTMHRLMVGACLFAVAGTAHAQETKAGDAEQAKREDIVVTGTRIQLNGNALPTPVTVVSPEILQRTTPSNVADALNKLPAFALSSGVTTTNNSSDNFSGNFLNLRGFGISRNLVLLDGHRVPPSSYSGAVDTNILPQALMKRVDVVTGGASAVYGSDAVSGVINFVLDNKFNGFKANALAGVSSRGDSFSTRFGGAAGFKIGERGHFEASFEHFQQDGLVSQERANGQAGYELAGNGSAANPFRLIRDARGLFFISSPGTIFSGPYAGQVFVAPGVPGPFTHGIAQGGALESGGDGWYATGTSARASLRTNQAFARFDYEVADDINFYVQGNYADSKTESSFFSNLIFPHLIAPDNPYLSAAMRANLTEPFAFGRVLIDPAGNIGLKTTTKVYGGAAGLDGKLGNFNWSAFYNHAQTTARNSTPRNTLNGNLTAALDAVDQGLFQNGVANGNIVCRSSLTNPGAYPGCIPLNLFGNNPASQRAALAYTQGENYNQPKYTLDSAELSVSGPLFEGWAGPVQMALSGEYRKLSLDVSTNGPANVFVNCTGLRFDCTPGATPVYRDFSVLPISRSLNVKEAAVELNVPLLKDSALGSASLNLAGRYTNYSTSGTVYTWKVGGDWQVTNALRFRGTVSRDIRAPGLFELYQPGTNSFSGFTDTHIKPDPSSIIVATVQSGNPNLVPEKADTITVGAVYRPEFIPGLSMSVDYYRIKIANAITNIDGRGAGIQRLCEDSGGTSPFCSLYVRPNPFSDTSVANTATLVKIQSLNVAQLKTWGIDAEFNYLTNVGGENTLSLRGFVSYQPKLTNIVTPGLPALENAGVAGGVGKWRLAGFVTYSTPHFSVDVQERWRSSLKWDSNPALVYAEPDLPAAAYTDITFTAYIGEAKKQQLFLAVTNLFDRQPTPYRTTGTAGAPGFGFGAVSGEDIIGRYFTAGFRVKY